jgi:hypothetical protein
MNYETCKIRSLWKTIDSETSVLHTETGDTWSCAEKHVTLYGIYNYRGMLNVNNIQLLRNCYHRNRLSSLITISTLKKEAACSTENFCATTLSYSPNGNTRKMYTDCCKDLKSNNEWFAYLPLRTVLFPLYSYQILLQITSVNYNIDLQVTRDDAIILMCSTR